MKTMIILWPIFLLSFLGCNNSTTGDGSTISSIEGIWYYIENDTVYGEVIFTQNRLWTYDEGGGEISLGYRIKNDSIEFTISEGEPYIVSKFIPLNENEFLLKRIDVTTHYYRLNIQVDTVAIFRGDEKAFDEYVINGLRVRKFEWENARRRR